MSYTQHLYIKERSANGTIVIPIEANMFERRIIFVEDEITQETSITFFKQLMELVRIDKEKPIKIVINSPGGSVDAGLAMYDMIQSTKTPVQMYCIGMAYSMAALLFLSGNHGRFLLEHSKLMIHEPLIKSFTGGNVTSVESINNSLKETKRQLDAIISKHSKKTIKEIAKSTSYDHYFSANEAIDYGLADRIVTFDELYV